MNNVAVSGIIQSASSSRAPRPAGVQVETSCWSGAVLGAERLNPITHLHPRPPPLLLFLLGAGRSPGQPVHTSLSVSAVRFLMALSAADTLPGTFSLLHWLFVLRQHVDLQRSVCSREASWISGRRGGEAAGITNRVLWWDLLEGQEFGFSEKSSVSTEVGYMQIVNLNKLNKNLCLSRLQLRMFKIEVRGLCCP